VLDVGVVGCPKRTPGKLLTGVAEGTERGVLGMLRGLLDGGGLDNTLRTVVLVFVVLTVGEVLVPRKVFGSYLSPTFSNLLVSSSNNEGFDNNIFAISEG